MGFSILHSLLRAVAISAAVSTTAWADPFTEPWHGSNTSIVLDAYEYTPLDWSKMKNNKRLAGFINKGSDGLPPQYRCGGNPLCRVTWRRYSAARELYHTRKTLAKTLGLKWGAYHVGRPGNPIEQANHFLRFTEPEDDELLALDIEHHDPTRWLSLEDAEIFARHIHTRIGRYPVLYTNHWTANHIATNRDKYPLLSRLNLWYARYKPAIPGVFPMGNWDSYTIWQFSSMINCSDSSCPWRINGAGNWIDVNVVDMPPDELRKRWPFSTLTARKPEPKPEPELLLAASQPASAVCEDVKTTTLPATTHALAPRETVAVSRQVRGVPRERPTRVAMAITGYVTTPTWKPGASILPQASEQVPEESGESTISVRTVWVDATRPEAPRLFPAERVMSQKVTLLDNGSASLPGQSRL